MGVWCPRKNFDKLVPQRYGARSVEEYANIQRQDCQTCSNHGSLIHIGNIFWRDSGNCTLLMMMMLLTDFSGTNFLVD